MTPPVLRTSRLRLTPYDLGDLDELCRLFTNPVVRRYLLDDQVVSREWVQEEIVNNRATCEREGLGQWGVTLLWGSGV